METISWQNEFLFLKFPFFFLPLPFFWCVNRGQIGEWGLTRAAGGVQAEKENWLPGKGRAVTKSGEGAVGERGRR